MSLVVVWQLKGVHRHRERPALRMIGAALVGLALYVLGQASYALVRQVHPEPPRTGLVWLIATVAAMLLLAWKAGMHGTTSNPPRPSPLTSFDRVPTA